jgi:hypothetical protein
VSLRRWVLVVSFIVLVAAACGGGDDDQPAAAPATTAAPTTAAPTTVAQATTQPAGKAKTYSIRGMTMTLRPEWTAEVDVDEGANVVTGQPCIHSKLLGDQCPSFLVFGPDGIFHGYEDGPYRLDQPYHPGTDVSPCQTAPDDGLEGAQTLVLSGLAKVGTKKANYREWRVTCVASSGNKPVGKPYVQRIWYLPKSQILVVDEWSTPGLAEALANARWN